MALPAPPEPDAQPALPGRVSEPGVRFLAPAGVDAAIAAIAASQYGVLGLHQLVAFGLSARAVQKRAAAGRLHRLHRGVYAVVPRPLLSREARWLASVLALGPHAVLSHRSAAALHGLRAYGSSRVDLTVPGRSRGGHAGIYIHRSTTLTEADVTIVRGIPCTTVARTLLDLGDVVGLRALERACDQAEILETFDLTAVQDQIERNRHRRGAAALRRVLDRHYAGPVPTWSEFERRFYALTDRLGLPRPEVNVFIDPGDGDAPILVDFLWRAQRVAVETDGKKFHLTHQTFETDRRKDQRLTVARWRPVRTTWRQLTGRPHELERTLKALIRETA